MSIKFLVNVGVTEDGEPLIHDFGSPWHLAIQGQTRSGKSVLTYGLLGSLSKYPECRVIGSDKSGILLAPQFHLGKEPLVALGFENMKKHVEILEDIVKEMARRTSLLWPQRLDKLDDFTTDLPLLVVAIEEYPGLIESLDDEDSKAPRGQAEKLKARAKRAVAILVAEGAKVGIRVVLLAQRFEASIVGGAVRSNFGFRVTLRVDNSDSVKMLHPNAEDDEVSAVELFLPGQGIVELPAKGRQIFRAYEVDYQKYVAHVEKNSM
jgi:S-DNA-T family DNA segregation ATPase FtsK/SpoIIIE